jgi:putative ABC transport system substrate-binding protein
MKRRGFITLLGGATIAWPLAARTQQPIPVVGFLAGETPSRFAARVRAFSQALNEAGYVEGHNVAIEYRWAEGQMERLPALATDLTQQRVAVLVAVGNAAALAAKAATTTVPTVFAVGEDPVRLGLVASLARPGGNLTGINFFAGELAAKRLELLRELVPGAVRVAVLLNPVNPNLETTSRDVEAAAHTMGLKIRIGNASTIDEVDAAFTTFAREQSDALFVGPDPFFLARRVQLALLAARHGVPATYTLREFVEAGGLMSYGGNITDAYRQVGAYVGRILKGAKPVDLPVVQSSKFELVINRQSARMLGLAVPDKLLVAADEVIE